jgi:hypothetical protein
MLIVGAGRAGSHVADLLARAGRRSFVLIDPDALESENVANHLLGPEWVGLAKAEGVANHLWTKYGAEVSFLVAPFGFDLLEASHPAAPLIYGQELILAHTDDPAVQRAVAVASANLEIPCIASGVYTDGGGEVFAQLDVDREPCYGCFTHPRHAAGRGARLRGRDLDSDAGAAVDAWVVQVALAVLEPRSGRARRVFAPNARTGLRTVWDIPAGVGRAPQPLNVERRLDCAVCGDAARRERGRGASDTPASGGVATPHRTLRSVLIPTLIAGVVMLAAAAFGLLLADPNTGHWIFFHNLVLWSLVASRRYAVLTGTGGGALLAIDGLIAARCLYGSVALAISYVGIAGAMVALVPVALLCALAMLTIGLYVAIGVAIACAILLMLTG